MKYTHQFKSFYISCRIFENIKISTKLQNQKKIWWHCIQNNNESFDHAIISTNSNGKVIQVADPLPILNNSVLLYLFSLHPHNGGPDSIFPWLSLCLWLNSLLKVPSFPHLMKLVDVQQSEDNPECQHNNHQRKQTSGLLHFGLWLSKSGQLGILKITTSLVLNI